MRLIDADALVQLLGEYDQELMIGWVEDAPTIDAAPVVRCRECAVPHNEKTGCPKLLGIVTTPDFFCKFGVRGEK